MIPKRFTLVNRKWVVRLVTSKQLQKHIDTHAHFGTLQGEDLKGLCDPDNFRLFINKDAHTNDGDMAHTFWHEFLHALKFADGESDHNEAEVDRLAGYLHQFTQTVEGMKWVST